MNNMITTSDNRAPKPKCGYNVDIVLVLDSTADMIGFVEEVVAQNALNFYDDVKACVNSRNGNMEINSFRVKVIAFRDYLADRQDAMLTSAFFNLPEDTKDFSDVLYSIECFGGGDEPEDGLEALAFAIRSKWNTEGDRRRQIIVVCSDAFTHKLGYGSPEETYPKAMARDFDELTRWWGDKQNEGYMDYRSKRLILFTPDQPGWSDITKIWDNVNHFRIESSNGLNEVTYRQLIQAIANSI